ncbi:MAG: PEP-CTERM sorting domain-containing protein [Candidatus Omnitrophota bacterium]
MKLCVLLVLAAVLVCTPPAFAIGNEIVNGSFETPASGNTATGKFPGWEIIWGGQEPSYNNWQRSANFPFATDGSWYAKCFWDGGLSQVVNAKGGAYYNLSFNSHQANAGGELATYWSGVNIEFINASGITIDVAEYTIDDLPKGEWIFSSYEGRIPQPATQAKITLMTWWDDDGLNPLPEEYYSPNPTCWDDINFSIPEPSSILLFLTGIMGCLAARRKNGGC